MHNKKAKCISLTRTLRHALIAAALVAAHTTTAHAAIDLLKRPALQSPLAAKSMLLGITLAGNRIVAVGERGIAVYSDDQGATWNQASVPVSVTLTAVRFADPTTGWAVGHDGVILITTDGGKSWRKQFDGDAANPLVLRELEDRVKALEAGLEKMPAKDRATAEATLETARNALEDAKAGAEFGPARPLFGLLISDTSHVTAIGSFGQIFHSADAGKTWESWGARIENSEGFHYNDITRLSDGALLIAGEAGKLRRSRNNGASWETLDTGYPGHLYGAVAFPASKVLITYGFAGNLFKSGDDGKTWTPLPRLTQKPLIGGVVLPDGTLLLLDRDRRVLISRDQGGTFTLAKSPVGRPIAAALPVPFKDKILVTGVGGSTLLSIDSTAH